METISQTVTSVKEAILGTSGAPTNEEPPSGVAGKGTIDSPYDQGNAPEKSADTSIVPEKEEPPSGVTGKGTLDSPYDQGNAPEKSADTSNVVSSGEPVDATTSPTHTAPRIVTEESSSGPGVPKLPSPDDPLASPSTTHQGSGNPLSEPTPQQEEAINESRGRDETAQRTTSTMLSPGDAKSTGTAAAGGNFDAAKPGAGSEATRLRYDRSVSPGQLDDGTHVQCSGDRGESYKSGNKLAGKLKDKFHFGHKK